MQPAFKAPNGADQEWEFGQGDKDLGYSRDVSERIVSTLGNVFTRKGGEEYHAMNFQTKCTVQIPLVVRVCKDIMQDAETQGNLPTRNPASYSRKR